MGSQVQQSLFEEDYLLRTLGRIVQDPYVALTELVANAWDAGASRVDVEIPDEYGGDLVIEDDGAGMTPQQFRDRWMTLAYNRLAHQGGAVEFPPGREHRKRPAYGKNGVGRHGLLCFADSYHVETHRGGHAALFQVTTQSGENPFVLVDEEARGATDKHGTTLRARLNRHLPSVKHVRETLASAFLADPGFSVYVNNETVPLVELEGFVNRTTLSAGPFTLEAICIDASKTGRTTDRDRHGVAFWASGRLVGEPSWVVGTRALLDGRTRLAKRLTIVVKSEGLGDHIERDWSAFIPSLEIDELYAVVSVYVDEITRQLMAEQIEETKAAAILENRDAIKRLRPLARLEVSEFVGELAGALPSMSEETLSIALQALIKLEDSRSGRMLLTKLAALEPEDVNGLNRLLDEWSVRDALTVLDEIQRRISIVEALEKLSGDKKVKELTTLHPLVTQARWLFGPEYESSSYASNVTIRTAVNRLFKERLPPESFVNPKKRPDLIFLADSTISAVGIEGFEPDGALAQVQRLLLLELKKGGSVIGRADMNQANGYVEDLLLTGQFGAATTVHAFVVGHEVDRRAASKRTVADGRGVIQSCSFHRLVQTANIRLFALRRQVEARYELEGADLATHMHAEQTDMFER